MAPPRVIFSMCRREQRLPQSNSMALASRNETKIPPLIIYVVTLFRQNSQHRPRSSSFRENKKSTKSLLSTVYLKLQIQVFLSRLRSSKESLQGPYTLMRCTQVAVILLVRTSSLNITRLTHILWSSQRLI